jgi:hypothetical protein
MMGGKGSAVNDKSPEQNKDRYLRVSSRDFFYVTTTP